MAETREELRTLQESEAAKIETATRQAMEKIDSEVGQMAFSTRHFRTRHKACRYAAATWLLETETKNMLY